MELIVMDIASYPAEKDFIDSLYKTKSCRIEEVNLSISPGQFVQLYDISNPKNKTLIYSDGNIIKIADTWKGKSLNGFEPKDCRQLAYFNQLEEEAFLITVATGAAGTGKTSVAMAKALSDYFKKKRKVILCKPTAMVQSGINNAFGPVPGDLNEKYAPYISSFEIILKKILGKGSDAYLQTMLQKKDVEFVPVEFTRGCTFEDCTFILDEVQNLTWHELKTVMSRIGDNSQIILCGDPDQIDSGFDYEDSGLCKLISSNTFSSSNFTTHIHLTKQYRGKIPDLIYHIDKE
jgi:PhoH-like ATPase